VAIGAMLVGSLFLAACQNVATNAGVYYNDGLAESFNSVLLKNIIRAAKNYPMYYSALGDFSYDRSTEWQFAPTVSIPLNVGGGAVIDGDIDIGLAPQPSFTGDRTANVSSLESENFTQAMHTRISGGTLLFFTHGRGRYHFNLLLMLLVDRLTLTLDQFYTIIRLADTSCRELSGKLSASYQGMCDNLARPQSATCAEHPQDVGTSGLVSFHNEPTNPCEFMKFKLFVEALTLTEPRVVVQTDGSASFVTGETASKTQVALFTETDTGIVLRSPHELISYLGRIVKQTFLGADDGLLTVTAENGKEVPIFVVEEGKDDGTAAVIARLDRQTYWIPQQSLRSVESHFSFAAMGVIKDIISLNTSADQLPVSPSRLVVNN
jgi:hypothetical protein